MPGTVVYNTSPADTAVWTVLGLLWWCLMVGHFCLLAWPGLAVPVLPCFQSPLCAQIFAACEVAMLSAHVELLLQQAEELLKGQQCNTLSLTTRRNVGGRSYTMAAMVEVILLSRHVSGLILFALQLTAIAIARKKSTGSAGPPCPPTPFLA